MKRFPLVLLLLFATTVSAEDWAVLSPDGKTTVTLTRQADGRLTWRAARGRATVIEESPLGIRREDQAFTNGLKLVRASTVEPVNESYQTPHGKRRVHQVRGNERTVAFTNAAGAGLEVVLRAHDDGVALRYRFPGAEVGERTVVEEATGFRLPAGSTGWLLPHHVPSRYKPAYEDLFREIPAGTTAPEPAGWSFPALFKTPAGKWALITEAALDGTYAGVRLAAEAPGGLYRVRFPDPGEGMGVGAVNPTSTLPWTMPWRVVIIGDAAARILESDLVSDLSPPSRLKDTSWIKPGRASWSWWSQDDSPKTRGGPQPLHRPRRRHGLGVFARWTPTGTSWRPAASRTSWRTRARRASASSSGTTRGGPHNDVTEAPRDRMHLRDVAPRRVREAEGVGRPRGQGRLLAQ